MRQRDRAVVRRDRIEVAVDDAHERRAIAALIGGNDPLGRWILREIFRVVQIGRRPSRLPRSIEAWIVGARDVPLRFGELLVLDAHAHGDDGGVAALLHRAVVRRLTGCGVQIPALHFAETGHASSTRHCQAAR